MIHSMTGFAAGSRNIGNHTLNLEIRSVNSRYLDLVFRMPDEVRSIEPLLREAIAARLSRGKVECRVNLQATQAINQDRTPNLNAALLEQLTALQQQVLAQQPQAARLSVAELLRWPGMLGDDSIDNERLHAEALVLINAALDELVASRAREGAKLAGLLRDRLASMREHVAAVRPRVPQVIEEYRERMSQRLREAVASLDEERIRQEAGVFATRIDVEEELGRLGTHIEEVERILAKGGAAGKRLDFLMQELNREANTLASKSVSSDITAHALDLKLLIEQMREQVQNLE